MHWTRASIGSKLLACVWLLPVTQTVGWLPYSQKELVMIIPSLNEWYMICLRSGHITITLEAVEQVYKEIRLGEKAAQHHVQRTVCDCDPSTCGADWRGICYACRLPRMQTVRNDLIDAHKTGAQPHLRGFSICAPEYHVSLDKQGDIYCRVCGKKVSQ